MATCSVTETGDVVLLMTTTEAVAFHEIAKAGARTLRAAGYQGKAPQELLLMMSGAHVSIVFEQALREHVNQKMAEGKGQELAP